MASVRKRNGKWEAQVRRKGFPTISKSFHLKSDALEWSRYVEQKADRRTLPYDPKRLDAVSLKGLLERYIAEVLTSESPESKQRCF